MQNEPCFIAAGVPSFALFSSDIVFLLLPVGRTAAAVTASISSSSWDNLDQDKAFFLLLSPAVLYPRNRSRRGLKEEQKREISWIDPENELTGMHSEYVTGLEKRRTNIMQSLKGDSATFFIYFDWKKGLCPLHYKCFFFWRICGIKRLCRRTI